MKSAIASISFLVFVLGLYTVLSSTTNRIAEPSESQDSIVDGRDNKAYSIVKIGTQVWFAENLRYESPASICYKKKKTSCNESGRLYPSSELGIVCPKGWRVPTIKDWNMLKANFLQDSIYALLDTVHWNHSVNHTNESGLSIRGSGYQMEKRLFLGEGIASTLWINQFNRFDEYYHVHLYGGDGISFEQSGHVTNEVFHAHPIEDIENRSFSIRCMCEQG